MHVITPRRGTWGQDSAALTWRGRAGGARVRGSPVSILPGMRRC